MRSSSRSSLVALLASSFLFVASSAQADNDALQRAAAAIARGDYAQAEKEVDGVKSGADKGAALVLKARIQLVTGRYDDAIATAKSAAALGKEAKIQAAPVRAQALYATGKAAEAIAACKEVENEDDARRARLFLGEVLIGTGKRGDARAPLMTLIDDYNNDKIKSSDAEGLSLVGRAAFLLRSPRDANDAFNAAEKAGAKNRPEALLWRGEAFLDKYNPGNAGQVTKEALKLAPKDPHARVMFARVKLESSMDFEAAESEVRQALEVNPKLAEAFFVRAGLALRDMDITGADKAADEGLKSNPSDLELLSMKAAIRFLADDLPGFESWKKQVFAVNPEYSHFFQIIGEFAEWEHRYDDIIKMMQEATKVDPNDSKAYADLGLNLIRAGDDDSALQALQKAWAKDKFNVRVYNTLNLYEKEIANSYVTIKGQTFNIRYAKEEKDVLERYVPKLLEEAWGSMVQRYGFTPKVPVSIELYSDQQDFSIRTSGLPNVGIQGVCFGQTLAAMSPHAGQFNWGNVLWHELGHVFAIQMSKNHVPRWFTEGLSEYETIIRRPEWQREEDPNLYAALKAKRIPQVEDFNKAFTHVDNVEDVTMAYYAASQIQVFAAKEFGFPKIVAMLPLWAKGERTPEVVQHALGITAGELDKRYRAWLDKKLSRYDKQYIPNLHAPPLDDARKAARANPGDASKMTELALALFADGQEQEGVAMLDMALKLNPKDPNANYVLLRQAMGKKDLTAMARIINKMIADGNDGYALRMKAADLAEIEKDTARMKLNFEAAAKLDPSQVEPLQGLYDLAHKEKNTDAEIALLRRLAPLDQHDRKVWNRFLALLLEKGQWEEARQVGESALFIDVFNAQTHRNYARALARTGKFVSAIFELNSALVCRPKPKEQAEIYGELATGYEKMGDTNNAKRARELQKQLGGGAPAATP